MSARPVPYRMGRLCWLGVHRKTDPRRFYSPCRGCGLPLFGPHSRPVTDEVTLRVYWRAMDRYELEDRSAPFPTLGGRIRRGIQLPW